jgi:murein DD-endopeptidase MepM/ murein hydrolase activator NlpD
MSLTVLYRGQNVRFSMSFSKPLWISLLLVFAITCGGIVHYILTPVVPAQPMLSQKNLTTIPATPEQVSKQQLAALTMKLADLQSHVLRLNALGERLASEADIPQEEFQFSQLPPTGGPTQSNANINELSLNQLMDEIASLSADITTNEKQLQVLESLSLGHYIEDNSYLSGRPISRGWLSSYYGVRKDPFTGQPAMHKGVDFAGKEGEPVLATGSGVVSWAGERYGYGNLVEIDHGTGFKTRYGHNKSLLVKVGDVVSKNQAIAEMGNTGRSTGPHVHYEILHGNEQINPIKYVQRKPKQ